jgi:hypothetical protein
MLLKKFNKEMLNWLLMGPLTLSTTILLKVRSRQKFPLMIKISKLTRWNPTTNLMFQNPMFNHMFQNPCSNRHHPCSNKQQCRSPKISGPLLKMSMVTCCSTQCVVERRTRRKTRSAHQSPARSRRGLHPHRTKSNTVLSMASLNSEKALTILPQPQQQRDLLAFSNRHLRV